MKVLFSVDYKKKSYGRGDLVEIPYMPSVGSEVSLWVHCGYYAFKVIGSSLNEVPQKWLITIRLEALPINPRLQEPLHFELDPRWK